MTETIMPPELLAHVKVSTVYASSDMFCELTVSLNSPNLSLHLWQLLHIQMDLMLMAKYLKLVLDMLLNFDGNVPRVRSSRLIKALLPLL